MFYNIISKIYSKISENKNVDKIRKIGDVLQFLCGLIFLSYCAIFNHYELIGSFAIFYLCGVVTVFLLKSLFDNSRPNETNSKRNPHLKIKWSPKSGNSFPSGHTMSAMICGLIWFEINSVYGIIGVLCGLFTAYSRVLARAHWLRDVGFSILFSTLLYVGMFVI